MRSTIRRGLGLARPVAPLAALVVGLLSGCAGWDPISDPPPDLEVQPLEVIVNSDSRPQSPCLLNVNQVRAGHHEVSIIGVSGFARIDIADQKGQIVFRGDNAGQRTTTNDAGEVTIHVGQGEGAGPPARLEAGTYVVRCRPEDGEPGEAVLRVLPARAGPLDPPSLPGSRHRADRQQHERARAKARDKESVMNGTGASAPHLKRAGRPLVLMSCALMLAACGPEAAGSADSCDEAMSILKSGEGNPERLADKFEQIAEGGSAQTREIFDPTIQQLRDLANKGADSERRRSRAGWEEITPVLDEFVTACGRPVR